MKELNFDFLINIPLDELVENIKTTFEKLIKEIKTYLNLEPIDSKIDISIHEEKLVDSYPSTDVFSIGVKRFYDTDTLIIRINKKFLKFIPIIILREAYKCFIPLQVSNLNIIDIFINQKVAIDLEKLESIKEWNTLIAEKLIDFEFISKEYNRLENFLKRESLETVESPFIFFFKYIRKNIQIINEKEHDFYNAFFEEYQNQFLLNDEIIETIYILVKIFYKVQYYTAFLDYQNFFKEFKKKGILDTNLSLNKFTENMLWIKQFSTISPSYMVNWQALNISSINCYMKFNPILRRSEINQIINELPFFVILKECRYSFAYETDGFFVIPNRYFLDLKEFLEKMVDSGYILQIKFTNLEKAESFVNLNYFREFHNEKTLVNRDNRLYENKYEIKNIQNYGKGQKVKLTLLDWLIIDRIRYYSQTGFNFERRAGTLKILKSDLMNEVISQRKFITDLKSNLLIFHSSSVLLDAFLKLLKTNDSFGFFYIKRMLTNYNVVFDLVRKILKNNSSIKSVSDFYGYVKRLGISYSIEDNIIFKEALIRNTLFQIILPLYFKSKTLFEEELDKFGYFSKVLNNCYNLKIFNLQSIRKIVQNKTLLETIFKSKENKLNSSYESYALSDITYQLIEEKLDNFLNYNPPIIKPELMSTIYSTAKHYYILLLKNNTETLDYLKGITFIAKRMAIIHSNLLYVGLSLPYLNNEEKVIFISILYNNFKDNLISIKRYDWSGHQEAFSRKDFYDLEQEEFFYTKDLFKQYFSNVRAIFGNIPKPLVEVESVKSLTFWSKEVNISFLIKSVEDRVRSEQAELKEGELNLLLQLHKDLNKILLTLDEYKSIQEKKFFKTFLESISFIPSFQKFGLSQYFLYFYPSDINQIDFKLLLNNSFQSISYPAQIDNSNSFLCKYIFPFRNPGISPYLNWLTKSKKIIREYCLFFIKKFYQIMHFNYNLNQDGWDLDPNRFKIYFQNILFNPDYVVHIPYLKEFNVGELNTFNYLGPNSSEFKALSLIYNWKSLDIKSYLTRRYFKIVSNISELLKKGLILPFMAVKNLDLVEEITIILPNVKTELNKTIKEIFSFFNIGFIYELEGEYYIHGFEDVIKFENGVMIKLFFPDCPFDEFERLFDLLFEYLEIDYYLILHDLIDGKNIIKNVFHSLKFLNSYNPITNLIWNDKDKKWRNHKLFDENFNPVYPDMNYGKKNYDLDS